MTGRGKALDRLTVVIEDSAAACLLASDTTLYDELTDQGALAVPVVRTDTIALDGARISPASPAADAPALLQYTSGSTGAARAVMLTHGNIIANERVISASVGCTSEDSVVCWLPLYHDMGLIGGVLQAVYVGMTCTMMSPLSFVHRPLRWLKAISRYRATLSTAPTFAYELCTRFADRKDAAALDLSSWRVALCGGETVRAPVLEAFATAYAPRGFDRRAFVPAYGLAETTLMATSMPAATGVVTVAAPGATGPAARRRHVICGQPGLDHEVAIVDPGSRTRSANGETGEIWLRGPSVAAGYWNRPEETEATFRARIAGENGAAPWLRTGDLGFLHQGGLVVTGRRKELLIVRGVNIDPQDLESLARECEPGLTSAAFMLEDDRSSSVVLVSEVARNVIDHLDPIDLAARVISGAANAFGLTLHDLVLVRPGALPRTTSGKIQRYMCRERYLEGTLPALPPIDHPSLGRCRSPLTGVR